MSSAELRKSRRNIILVVVAFIVPIVLAKLALSNNWFNEAATNKGVLLQNELTISQLGLEEAFFKQKWLIIYQLPKNCGKPCELALYGINQVHTSLGREVERVIPVGLKYPSMKLDTMTGLTKEAWQFSEISTFAENNLDPKFVYVADPLGNIILSYVLPQTDAEVLTFGKSLLADLRKLLKYSRVG